MILSAKFKNSDYETQFNEQGYIHIPCFLSAGTIEYLLNLYKEYHTTVDPNQMMWNSLYDVGLENGLKISEKIKDAIHKELDATFEDWKFPVATFMSKNPIERSICELHRDYTVFDEDNFQFRNVWIPLVDIMAENGALCVVPKSHRVFADIRPMFMEWPYKHLDNELSKYSKIVHAKAGDLVVYADRTLHASLNNNTHETRPVVHGGILNEQAELHYYQLNNKTLNIFKVPFDFYFSGKLNTPDLSTIYPLIETKEYAPIQIGFHDLANLAE